MTFTVVVPYSGVGIGRDRALAAVLSHLDKHHGEWHRIVVPYDATVTGKGSAVAAGVEAADTEGLIVHDADVLVSPESLRRAALAVIAGAPWAMPHRTVYRLSRRYTMTALTDDLIGLADLPPKYLERHPHPAPPGGGCTVLSRSAWDATGGIDPRFVGWGGEDISWARALDTLTGEGWRGDAPMWHLWHEHDPTRLRGGRGSRDNERLASRYLDAVGNPEAMREVVTR